MTVDQSMSPGSSDGARGRRTDLHALHSEWQAVHGELSAVVEAILSQIFATASRQAVEALARLDREGTELLANLEARRAAAEAEMTELADRLEHLERRVTMAEEERRQALDAAERATSELLVRARSQADEIVGDAEARAAARLAEAQEEAARRIADAEARAAQIVEEAQRRAEEVEREAERDAARFTPEPELTAVVEAAAVEDQLRGLAERISRLLQTTSEVTSTEATAPPASREEATAAPTDRAAEEPSFETEAPPLPDTLTVSDAPPSTTPSVVPFRSAPDDERTSERAETLPPSDPAGPPEPVHAPPSVQPYTFAPHPAEATGAPSHDADDVDEAPPERDVVVPLRPRTAQGTAAPAVDAQDDEGNRDEMPALRELAERDVAEHQASEREAASAHPNGLAGPARPHEVAAAGPVGPNAETEAGADELLVQTLVFQAVPNFQAALALERALKGLPGVSDVRVADFDERQLTFQVTHDLGTGLTRNVLALRSHDLDLVDSGRDRAEFVFRA